MCLSDNVTLLMHYVNAVGRPVTLSPMLAGRWTSLGAPTGALGPNSRAWGGPCWTSPYPSVCGNVSLWPWSARSHT